MWSLFAAIIYYMIIMILFGSIRMFPYYQPSVLIVLKRRVWIFSVHEDIKACYVLGNRGDESAHALTQYRSEKQKACIRHNIFPSVDGILSIVSGMDHYWEERNFRNYIWVLSWGILGVTQGLTQVTLTDYIIIMYCENISVRTVLSENLMSAACTIVNSGFESESE